jgi:diguanylate cyclase (GGDEF)-like protein
LPPFERFRIPVVAALLWAVTTSLMIALHERLGMQAVLWLPSAVAVAALYLGWRTHRYTTLATLAAASVAVGALHGDGPVKALAFTLANLAGTVVVVRIARSVANRRRLDSLGLKQMIGLSLAALAGAAANALLTVPWHARPLLAQSAGWIMGQALAVAVGVPMILYVRSWAPGAKYPTKPPRWFLPAMVAMFALAWCVLGEGDYPLGPLTLAGLAFAVFRYGQLGAAATVLVFGLAGMLHSIGGATPVAFVHLPPFEAGLMLQAYMLLMLASGLPVAALLMNNGRMSHLLQRRNVSMRENLKLLRLTEDIARIGRWRYYPRSGKQDWSREMFRLNGLDPGLGRDPGNIRSLLPDDGAELFGHLSHHARDRAPYSFEYRIRTPRGEERVLKLQARNEFDEAGKLACMFGVAIDVTQHRQQQDSLDRERTAAMRLAAEAQHLAQTDALTGLANRRRTIDQLEKCIARCNGRSHSLAVIAFDIDHFKRVNDRFGHQAGDEVLVRVAEVARGEARASDLIGRIGGEEFLWLLPEAGEPVARAAAMRLREAIEEKSGEDGLPPVTASIGYALWQDGDDAGGLLARADAALYAAKHAGRNKVQRAA